MPRAPPEKTALQPSFLYFRFPFFIMCNETLLHVHTAAQLLSANIEERIEAARQLEAEEAELIQMLDGEEPEHTPGPWRYVPQMGLPLNFAIVAEDGTIIAITDIPCDADEFVDDDDEARWKELEAIQEANARRIAAVPTLLNTCHYVLGMLRQKGDFPDEIQELEGAIAQAEGR